MRLQIDRTTAARVALDVVKTFQPGLLVAIQQAAADGTSEADVKAELRRQGLGLAFSTSILDAAFWPMCGECGGELTSEDLDRGEATCLDCMVILTV